MKDTDKKKEKTKHSGKGDSKRSRKDKGEPKVAPMNSVLSEAATQLDQMCYLRIDKPALHRRLTNVIGSIAKGSRKLELIEQMIKAGMTVARINMSHESHEAHDESIRLVREAATNIGAEQGYPCHVAIAMDTKGPEIRTGFMDGGISVELHKEDILRLSTDADLFSKGNKDVVFVDYANIINVAEIGEKVLVDDGEVVMRVKEVAVDCVVCVVEIGGLLGSRKTVQLSKVPDDLPTFSEKDRSDVRFAIEHGLDFIFPSFVRSVEDIQVLRKLLGDKGKRIKILAKIENVQGMEDVDSIIKISDGLIVSRADIGVMLPVEKVFLVQKGLIAHCNKVGKPVVCATQFLESMSKRPVPTRSEVADVGNAVLDGADCIMLGGETGIGKYPVETIATCHSICQEAETALWYRDYYSEILAHNPAMVDASHAVAIATVEASKKSMASAIVVLTTSGKTAQLLAKYRPRCAIVAVTRCPYTVRHMLLHRGVVPVLYTALPNDDWITEVDLRVRYALITAKKMGITKMGDSVVIVSPWKDGGGFANNMRIVYAFYERESYECVMARDKRAAAKLEALLED